MKNAIRVCAAFASIALLAVAPSPPPLPPGMTPQLMKMMMTLPTGPVPAMMPAGTKAASGCIPTMGYHYAKPTNWPFGPLYGYYNGKPIFTEIMVDQKMFASGKSWDSALAPLPGQHIDHVDIWFESHGHPGYPIPHYDIHAWYVPHAEHMKYCGNTAGTRPPYLQ